MFPVCVLSRIVNLRRDVSTNYFDRGLGLPYPQIYRLSNRRLRSGRALVSR
jgi:hypothetical protein